PALGGVRGAAGRPAVRGAARRPGRGGARLGGRPGGGGAAAGRARGRRGGGGGPAADAGVGRGGRPAVRPGAGRRGAGAAGRRRGPVAAVGGPGNLTPTPAWGAAGDLRAVGYPDDWARARRVVHGDPAGGAVLVLPWEAHRSYPWNRGRRVLEPLPRYLHGRRVVVNDAVTVGDVTVPPEDPRAVRLAAAARTGSPPVATLREEGIRYVVVDAEIGSQRPSGPAVEVMRGRDLAVYRIDGASRPAGDGVPAAPVIA